MKNYATRKDAFWMCTEAKPDQVKSYFSDYKQMEKWVIVIFLNLRSMVELINISLANWNYKKQQSFKRVIYL